MKKIKFLLVLSAMMLLSSCILNDEQVVRYEVKSENPSENCVIENNTSECCKSWNPHALTDTLMLSSGSNSMDAPMFFKSKSYVLKFIIILILGILTCALAVSGISRKEFLQPKNKSIIRIILSVLIWQFALHMFIAFFLMFFETMRNMLLENQAFTQELLNSVSLVGLSTSFIFVAFGISVFNYRKTYHTTRMKIVRVIFSIIVLFGMFDLQKVIIKGFDSIGVMLSFLVWFCIVIRAVISIRYAKLESKPEDVDNV